MPVKPRTIDEYLLRLSGDKRVALQKLRESIKAAAPRAEECVSYGMPAFRLDGRILVWFGAAKHHCSFFPGAHPIAKLKDQLAGYETSKGTVRFPPEAPLPAALVKKLVRTRMRERSSTG